MPTYVRTLSFSSFRGRFRPEKDDPRVNAALDQLQQYGGRIMDIRVSLGSNSWGGVTASYVIMYEARAPIPL